MNIEFVWIDLEMTGLNPQHDVILEIATIITDGNLNIVAEGPNLVIHQPETILRTMDAWNVKHHGKSGLIEQVRSSKISVTQAELATLNFIKSYCQPQRAYLCGNSAWVDRVFLKAGMPLLESYLHYRIIDVSSIKELIKRWYSTSPFLKFKKEDGHRALQDIKDSIEELKHYRTHFFIPPLSAPE